MRVVCCVAERESSALLRWWWFGVLLLLELLGEVRADVALYVVMEVGLEGSFGLYRLVKPVVAAIVRIGATGVVGCKCASWKAGRSSARNSCARVQASAVCRLRT